MQIIDKRPWPTKEEIEILDKFSRSIIDLESSINAQALWVEPFETKMGLVGVSLIGKRYRVVIEHGSAELEEVTRLPFEMRLELFPEFAKRKLLIEA